MVILKRGLFFNTVVNEGDLCHLKNIGNETGRYIVPLPVSLTCETQILLYKSESRKPVIPLFNLWMHWLQA